MASNLKSAMTIDGSPRGTRVSLRFPLLAAALRLVAVLGVGNLFQPGHVYAI
jgi:hypothetical protein